MDRSFELFNVDRTKNGEVTQFMPLKLKINKYTEQINIAVTDLNDIDMFLGYNWLVKHNLEVNQNIETIWFIRCLKEYQNSKYQTWFIFILLLIFIFSSIYFLF